MTKSHSDPRSERDTLRVPRRRGRPDLLLQGSLLIGVTIIAASFAFFSFLKELECQSNPQCASLLPMPTVAVRD